MEKITNAPITPIRPLPGDSTPFGVINTTPTRGGNEKSSRGEGGDQSARTHPPLKKRKPPKEETVWITVPSPSPWRTTVLNLEFKPYTLVIGVPSSHIRHFVVFLHEGPFFPKYRVYLRCKGHSEFVLTVVGLVFLFFRWNPHR